jgi:hypothetical protein
MPRPYASAPSRLQATLKTLQAQLSAAVGRPLSQGELAGIADMNPRSFAEWMRGATSPASAQALLRLLSEVPVQDLSRVLQPWNEGRVQALANESSASRPVTRSRANGSRHKQRKPRK